MARVALALPSLLLLLAAVPAAEAAEPAADLAQNCIGPKLTGDQPIIARPYPGGGYEVFAGVDPSALGSVGSDGVSRDGGDYVGAGAYVLGPGCEATGILSSVTA